MLEQYGAELQENVAEAVKAVSKQGAKAVRSAAQTTFGGTGAYAKGWTSRADTGRVSAQGYIYNKDLPGLPHLLENGHVVRNKKGTYGRTNGIKHIAPVEDWAVEELPRRILEDIP